MGQSTYSQTARNDQLTQLNTDLAGAVIKIFDGPQPANPDTAPGASNHILATFTAPNPFGSVATGVLTANAIAAVSILLAGVATWFRCYKADGVTPICDGNIGNQTVTLTAAVALNATAITVQALTQPVYGGQVIVFNDGGTLKAVTVSGAEGTLQAAAGATSVPITAAAQSISNGVASTQNATVNNPNFQPNAQASFSSLTLTAAQAGT